MNAIHMFIMKLASLSYTVIYIGRAVGLRFPPMQVESQLSLSSEVTLIKWRFFMNKIYS